MVEMCFWHRRLVGWEGRDFARFVDIAFLDLPGWKNQKS